MSHNARRAFAAVVPAVAITIALMLTGQTHGVDERPAEAPASFTLSSRSTDTVLEVTFSGGFTTGEITEYRMYGDGRLVKATRSGSRERAQEVALSHVEMRELIGLLIEGNLMNWLDEETKQRFESTLGGIPSYVDVGRTTITLSLESYGEAGPVTKEISYAFPPQVVKLLHPDVALPEIDALDAFWEQMKRHLSQEASNAS